MSNNFNPTKIINKIKTENILETDMFFRKYCFLVYSVNEQSKCNRDYSITHTIYHSPYL